MLIEVAISPFKQYFTYELIEDHQNQEFENLIGCLIEVPFGKRKVKGIIIATRIKSSEKTKYQIKSIKDYVPLACFTKEQMDLIKWTTSYHRQNFSKTLLQIAPSQLKLVKTIKLELVNSNLDLSNFKGKIQQKIINTILQANHPLELNALKEKIKSPSLNSALNKLIEKNIIKKTFSYNQIAKPEAFNTKTPCEIQLNKKQLAIKEACSQKILTNTFQPYLLYGVTGSGKTEVYIELVKVALSQKKSALVLVPEIALTPQLINRFKDQLDTPIAILHSGIKDKERNVAWQNLIQGKIRVVIGVRSAIFAPLKNLGLIVVDEEHDSSYKQSDNFRYHARDLAVKRAQLNSCPVILGSATPTLESLYNAKNKRYELVKLTERYAERPHPIVKTIDLNKLKKKDLASTNISIKLAEAIQSTLDQNEQVFLLYNRRGFAAYLQCKSCGESLKCPNCDITLTYHQANNNLLCHICSYQQKIIESCPSCKSTNSKDSIWIHLGSGTEKIDQEIKKLFPQAKIARFDRDVIKTSSDYENILNNFRERKADILIGTQMIAKGHDIPNVTLVGVINCDVGLHLPDFRASEKCFQLLTQVAGRAGRGQSPGSVYFQTRQINHPSLVYSSKNDLTAFVNHEIKQRQTLNYPPFSKLLRIVISSEDEQHLNLKIKHLNLNLQDLIKKHDLKITCLGPAPAPLYKLRKHYRWHFIIKSQELAELFLVMDLFNFLAEKNKKLRIISDIDPQDML